MKTAMFFGSAQVRVFADPNAYREELKESALPIQCMTMTYRGSVKNGVVVLKRGAKLADGTAVRVQPVGRTRAKKRPL